MKRPLLSHIDALSKMIEIEGKEILDVGAGAGQMSICMIQRGAKSVQAIECSMAMLEKLSHLKIAEVKVLCGKGEALPCLGETADLVLYLNSFHHIPLSNQEQALVEARRCLRRSGVFVVAEPEPFGPYFELTRLVDDEKAIREQTWDFLSKQKVFELLEEFYYFAPKVYESFAEFEGHSISVAKERASQFRENHDQICQKFYANSVQTDKGYEFRQPMRVKVMKF